MILSLMIVSLFMVLSDVSSKTTRAGVVGVSEVARKTKID